jgi:2,3-bisphosphoglycerate-independent phosphoglycerate mutase
LSATIEAVELLDKLVAEVADTALSYNGVVLITADHGNAEGMYNLQNGEIEKEHSNNAVPLFVIGQQFTGKSVLPGLSGTDLSQITAVGVLADVSPTILKIMGLKKPAEMTGSSLV